MKMNREDIRLAVLEFLALIEQGKATPEANLLALELSLDRLALAHNFVEFEYDEHEYPDAPRESYDQLRLLATQRFPDFGYYNEAEDLSDRIAESSIIVGDAIDDIADLARDLREVLWCWEHTSTEDALWHFQFGYESHWGAHLRRLQLYVYELKKNS
jgi:hypothetical protein